jgi:predicted TIM-barrel enzyme
MPNPWTGIGNPYTKLEVVDRLKATLAKGEPIIAAGAGTGISAKFIEKGGADLIIIYNSGRFRMRATAPPAASWLMEMQTPSPWRSASMKCCRW